MVGTVMDAFNFLFYFLFNVFLTPNDALSQRG